MWVSTTGTAVAEKLDTIAYFTTWGVPLQSQDSPGTEANTNVVEQLLNTLLLQHQLNKPALEFEPVDGAWNICGSDRPSPEPNASTSGDGGTGVESGEYRPYADPNDEPPPC